MWFKKKIIIIVNHPQLKISFKIIRNYKIIKLQKLINKN